MHKRLQKGFSLIELMVSFAISLVLVIGAFYLYSGTRNSQQALDQATGANDVGMYLLRLVGRDIGNAGFYPSISAEAALPYVVNGYTNITSEAAYDQGIFGCEGALFNVSTGDCATPVPGAPDTLVVAYFTNDAYNGQAGHRVDCEGADVSGALVNTGRQGSGTVSKSPQLPLFVANHYTVDDGSTLDTTTTMQIDGRTVTTRSLRCKGLVSDPTTNVYTPVMAGLDDFQVTYGVAGTPASSMAGAPIQFVNADAVNGLGSLTVDGVTQSPWRRVVAVRVCMVARTFEAGGAAASTPQSWQDCSDVTQPGDDQSVRKTFSQVFSVRNHLNATY